MNMVTFTHLCHKLFIGNPDGKLFLEMMEKQHLIAPVFPADLIKMEQHGGALGWAAFRAGQLNIVHMIKNLAADYEAKQLAESKKQT